MTLGTFLILFAALDLAFSFLMGMNLARRQQELPPEQRSAAPFIVVGAGFLTAAILCILAFYLPESDLVIF